MKKINILIIISLLVIFGSNIRPALGHEPSENQQSSHRESLGPEHIWKASTNVWGDLYSKCLDSNGPDSPALIHCVSTFMKAKGATAKAIAFMKLMDGEAYLTSFKETGRVDIGRLYYIFRVNDNSALAFLNGNERVLDVDLICCAEADSEDSGCECPEGAGSARLGYHPEFQSVTLLPGGGQRFMIRYENRRCHACNIESFIYDAYDFNSAGKFMSASFLYERAASVMRKR